MSYQRIKLVDLLVPISKQIQPKDFGDKVYIGLEHLKSGNISFTDVGVASQVKSTKWEFQSGDILYGKLRPYLNKCAVADRNGICSTDILVLRANKDVDAKYVAYCLSGSDFVAYANATVSGMNLPRTTWSKFNDYEVVVPVTNDGKPDLAEQKHISSQLDKVFFDITKGVAEIESQEKWLATLKKTLLANSLSNAEWETCQLGELLDYRNGLWNGKDGALVRAKVIRVTEMKDDGTYDLSTAKELQVEERKLASRKVVPNSILLERSGGGENKPVGRVVFFGDDVLNDTYSFSNFTTLLIPKTDLVVPKYLFYFVYYFHLSGNTKQLQKAVTGIRNLEFAKYLEQKVPIPFRNGKPDLVEQGKIVDELDKNLEMSEKMRIIVARQSKLFFSLRSSVLNQSFQMQT